METDIFRLNSDIESEHWWFAARRRILHQLVREVLPPTPENTILDVGCGTGGNTAFFVDQGYRCIGIDASADAVELAKARYPDLHFINGRAPRDVEPLAAETKLFLLADMLEHVPDDFDMLSQLMAVAGPGAYFLLTVPAEPSLWSPHDENHGHYRRYDRRRLEWLWQGLPATTLLVSHFNTRLYPAVKLVRALNRRRGGTKGEAGTDLRLPPTLVNRFLTRIFQGEERRLSNLLHRKCRSGYSFGVSLVALVRREEGLVVPHHRPTDVAADEHDPAARRLVNSHAQ